MTLLGGAVVMGECVVASRGRCREEGVGSKVGGGEVVQRLGLPGTIARARRAQRESVLPYSCPSECRILL